MDDETYKRRIRRTVWTEGALVLVLATMAVVAVTQIAAKPSNRPSVSANISPAAPVVSATVRVRGRVRGLGSRPQVVLQRRTGRRWQRVTRPVRSRSGGRYTLRWQPTRAGYVRLRVRASRAGRVATSRSRRIYVSAAGAAGEYAAGNWPPGNWRPFRGSSPFYERLPSTPRLVSNSAAIVDRLFANAQSSAPPVIRVSTKGKQGGTPTYFSRPSDPTFRMQCTRDWGGCGVDGQRVRIPAGAKPEGGVASSGTDGGTDSHMTVIDQRAGMEYEFWQVQASRIPASGGTLRVSYGGRFPLSGNGLGSSAVGGGGSNAALFSDIIGRPRVESLEAGEISHALTVVINCTNGSSVFPSAPSGTGTQCSNPTNAPPMGTRFQLDYSDSEIDALAAPEHRKVIYRAMAHYGLIVGDTEADHLFNLELDSDYTYNSFGAPSRWLQFARSTSGWQRIGGEYVSDLGADGIDWHRLRVVAPCVSEGRC